MWKDKTRKSKLKMNSNLQLLILLVTSAVFTAAMPCKMILEKSSNENMGATNDVMEMGQYIVRTTRRTDSVEIRKLISTLDGATDIQYKHNSFTAVLQPKDLKKVQYIVRSNICMCIHMNVFMYDHTVSYCMDIIVHRYVSNNFFYSFAIIIVIW